MTKNEKVDCIIYDASKISEELQKLLSRKKFSLANKLCYKFIQKNKKILQKYQSKNSEIEFYELWRLLVLFKALQDYIRLCYLTEDKLWYKQHKLIEKIWSKKCDCSDRLETILDCYSGEIVDKVLVFLSKLEEVFKKEFGDGLYNSIGLTVDKLLCSICGKDTRGCEHLYGRLYDGKICRYKPLNIQIDHVSLVINPKDKRCRVWPWQVKKDGTVRTIAFTLFRVDDFLSEGN